MVQKYMNKSNNNSLYMTTVNYTGVRLKLKGLKITVLGGLKALRSRQAAHSCIRGIFWSIFNQLSDK